MTVLQVPTARCVCQCLFNPNLVPKPLCQIRLSLTAGVSVADGGSDVSGFSVSVNYRAGNTGLASALLRLATGPGAAQHVRPDSTRMHSSCAEAQQAAAFSSEPESRKR